jgi:hypothetical protein
VCFAVAVQRIDGTPNVRPRSGRLGRNFSERAFVRGPSSTCVMVAIINGASTNAPTIGVDRPV